MTRDGNLITAITKWYIPFRKRIQRIAESNTGKTFVVNRRVQITTAKNPQATGALRIYETAFCHKLMSALFKQTSVYCNGFCLVLTIGSITVRLDDQNAA